MSFSAAGHMLKRPSETFGKREGGTVTPKNVKMKFWLVFPWINHQALSSDISFSNVNSTLRKPLEIFRNFVEGRGKRPKKVNIIFWLQFRCSTHQNLIDVSFSTLDLIL